MLQGSTCTVALQCFPFTALKLAAVLVMFMTQCPHAFFLQKKAKKLNDGST